MSSGNAETFHIHQASLCVGGSMLSFCNVSV